MRGVGGILAFAIAALLVCYTAGYHQAADEFERSLERYDMNAFRRQLREAGGHYGFVPYFMIRRFDHTSPYGARRNLWPVDFSAYYEEGLPKRNFDEIDQSGLDTFVKRRDNDMTTLPDKRIDPNFDEIDQSELPIGSKRQ